MKKEVVAAVLNASLQMQVSLTNGGKDWDKITAPLYKAMSDDIKKQKKRLGGDFAIAHAVNTRVGRDLIRKEMGDDVVFIVLNLTPACQEARIKAGFIFVPTFFAQRGKCSPFLELTPTPPQQMP